MSKHWDYEDDHDWDDDIDYAASFVKSVNLNGALIVLLLKTLLKSDSDIGRIGDVLIQNR